MLETVTAIRYVTPLREGGSLPGVVEANDLGTYVAKFRGAGQGPKALIADVIGGELARRLALPTPRLVVLDLDPVIGRSEPDEEVQDLLRASGRANLGVDFLSGALGYEPVLHPVDEWLASRVLWLDAYIENVDRSWRNPNLLVWHKHLYLIDHGAALYFHHDWARAGQAVLRPFRADDHVLRDQAAQLPEADADARRRVTEELLTDVLEQVPAEWLIESGFEDAEQARAAYRDHLVARIARSDAWLPVVTA